MKINYLKPIPELPGRKGISAKTSFSADGVEIEATITLDSDTREHKNWEYDHWLTYHIVLESVNTTERGAAGGGTYPVPNPISETGYRSHFFHVGIETEKNSEVVEELENYYYKGEFNFESYFKSWISDCIEKEKERWEESKQISLFNTRT